MNTILLRFRDTDANDTIALHTAIIKQHGKCWWGWWKKESEPSRVDIIRKIAKERSKTKVFLFDRSTDRFFATLLKEVNYSAGKDYSACPDKSLTPDYYHDENLSCWFLFSGIEQISKDKFLQEAGGVPTDDLTFFVVDESGKKKKAERTKLVSNNILHLSDIHFGDESNFGFPPVSRPNNRALLDIITDYVNNEFREKIGLLIVSGDITSRGDASYLQGQGIEFLKNLTKKLGVDKRATIIIPGNHDIPLSNPNYINYQHETSFRLFLKEFYGTSKDLHGMEYFTLPDGTNLDILRINSVKLRKKEESNYGYVEWPLYNNLLNGSLNSESLKLAVIHHHLVAVPVEETLDTSYPYASISVTLDSGRVIEGLQKKGFKLVLNGHQHTPGVVKISRGIIDNSNKIQNMDDELYILSAGSAGAHIDRLGAQMKYNSFSIYKIQDPNTVHVFAKAYNPSMDPRNHYETTIKLR